MTQAAAADHSHHLREVEIFSHFNDEHLRLLSASGRSVRFDSGDRVFGDGEEPSSFYLILHGNVVIQRSTPTGEIAGWHALAGGDYF